MPRQGHRRRQRGRRIEGQKGQKRFGQRPDARQQQLTPRGREERDQQQERCGDHHDQAVEPEARSHGFESRIVPLPEGWNEQGGQNTDEQIHRTQKRSGAADRGDDRTPGEGGQQVGRDQRAPAPDEVVGAEGQGRRRRNIAVSPPRSAAIARDQRHRAPDDGAGGGPDDEGPITRDHAEQAQGTADNGHHRPHRILGERGPWGQHGQAHRPDRVVHHQAGHRDRQHQQVRQSGDRRHGEQGYADEHPDQCRPFDRDLGFGPDGGEGQNRLGDARSDRPEHEPVEGAGHGERAERRQRDRMRLGHRENETGQAGRGTGGKTRVHSRRSKCPPKK